MPEIPSRSQRDDGFADPRRRVLLLTLTMTSSLGMVASTIYVPSIPAIASALETSIARVQFTFVGYLLAFALSMLALGPLSDRYGRRQTIIGGLVLSALSSLVCALSPTIEFLIVARVVQGVGACAGLVVGRAITRELWAPEAAAQVIAGRAIAATLMQAFAPVLGGFLQGWFGWRANFVVVALLACAATALVIRYVPKDRAANRPPFRIGPTRRRHLRRVHRRNVRRLSVLDWHAALPVLRIYCGRFPRRVSHLRRWRSGGIDRRLRRSPRRLRLLRFAAADGVSPRQFSVEPIDATARH